MIKAKHHSMTIWFYDLYFRMKMKFHFAGIKLHGVEPAVDKSVLLIQNHFSWWDGYWSMYLSLRFFRRSFHVMMLEEQLKRYTFINRCGGFSVKKGSRSVIESLNYAETLLEDPTNLVCMYPQGEIQSQYHSKLQFEQGISRLAKHTFKTTQLVFCLILLDYFSNPKPIIHIYTENYNGRGTHQSLEQDYMDFRNRCIQQQEQNKVKS